MAEKLCPDCDAPINPWQEQCSNRRACEGRQMLEAGLPIEIAANHAQRVTPRSEGLAALAAVDKAEIDG